MSWRINSDKSASRAMRCWVVLTMGIIILLGCQRSSNKMETSEIKASALTADLSYRSIRDKDLQKLIHANYIELDMSGSRFSLRHLETLTKIRSLERLQLNRTSLTHQHVRLIRKIPQLTHLSLSAANLSKKAIEGLYEMTTLKVLDLSFVKLSRTQCVKLQQLSKLEELYLGSEGNDFPLLGADSLSFSSLQVLGLVNIQHPPHVNWLDNLKQLTELHIYNSRLSNQCFQRISGLAHLHTLQLEQVGGVTSAGLLHLKRCPLTTLAIEGKTIDFTPRILEMIRSFPRLKQLSFSGSSFCDNDLLGLQGMKSLTTLNINATNVKGDGLRIVSSLPNLQTIDVSYLQLHSLFIHLSKCQSLRKVVSAFNLLPASDMDYLARMNQLVQLNLVGSNIDDTVLSCLTKLPNLTHLDLSHTSVTLKGLEQVSTSNTLQQIIVLGLTPTSSQIRHLRQTVDNVTFVFE